MALIINVNMKRYTPAGIVCNSLRTIVIWGGPVSQKQLDTLENALVDVRQLYFHEAFLKSQSDIIREVCDRIFPGRWDFVQQGGTIEF